MLGKIGIYKINLIYGDGDRNNKYGYRKQNLYIYSTCLSIHILTYSLDNNDIALIPTNLIPTLFLLLICSFTLGSVFWKDKKMP